MNISRQEFLVEVPRLYPNTDEHINFWRKERKRCIEGYWASGYWMPGKLYFYVNYSTIKLNVQGSKVKSLGKPWLRDIEWMFFRLLEEARGFSGFEEDQFYSCHEALTQQNLSDEEIILRYCTDEATGELIPSKFNNIYLDETLARKKYVSPREYIAKQHVTNLGRPLYNNQSKNLFMIGARGYGKSYMMGGGVVTHEFLFDGLTQYIPQKDTNTSSEIVVGAGDAKYSSDTLEKVRLTIENLPGSVEINGKDFPAPFSKKFTGSWYPGKTIKAEYRKKIGGNWKKVGTKSSIKHRTFKDNPFAANGTRPGIMLFEEVGMFDNLKESYVASVECQRNGDDKFGTMVFIGTGGDMHGGGCLTGETKVWDSEGNLHLLKDLNINKGIKGFDIKNQEVSNEPITYWQDYTEKPCYRITTNTGRYIQASEEHPLLCSKASNFRHSKKINRKRIYWKKVDWIQAKDVKPGYQLAIADKVPITSSKVFKHARLIGLLIGDGSYNDTPILSNNDADIWNYIHKNYRSTEYTRRVCKDGSIYRECSILGMRSYLKEIGILGQTKENKTLPLNIHSYNKESISDLLGGLFDADGYVLKDCIGLAIKHFSLIDEIRLLLQRLGIHCNIRHRINKPNKLIKISTDHYELLIKDKRSIKRFYRNIQFISKIKQLKLTKLYYNLNTKIDYYSKENIGLRFERVISIEKIGIHPVYNLTANKTNTYLGNGIVTHNTRDAYEMFYNPEAYDCLVLNDDWEHRGKIGFFVPAYLGLNQYKNADGFTDEARAKKYLEEHRRKLLSAGSTTALDGEMINRPIKPSEIFLLKHGNIFPIHELQERLSKIERPEVQKYLQTPVSLYFDERSKTGVNYKVDTKGRLRPINDFPFDGDDREGAIVIYEFPITDEEGNVPKDMYIIGHDPYASDDPTGGSLASIYVLKTKKYMKHGHDEIVASFVGRPYYGRNVYNEHLMKLSMFYGNAKIYFEATGNTKEYFEKHKRLDLLAKQPQTIFTKKAAYETKGSVMYGYPMQSRQQKSQAIQYLRDWLLEERGINEQGQIVRNLDRIPDKALLQELIAFNYEGNFDRVMGFAGCILGMEEGYNQYNQEMEKESQIDHAVNFFSTNRLFKSIKYARQF